MGLRKRTKIRTGCEHPLIWDYGNVQNKHGAVISKPRARSGVRCYVIPPKASGKGKGGPRPTPESTRPNSQTGPPYAGRGREERKFQKEKKVDRSVIIHAAHLQAEPLGTARSKEKKGKKRGGQAPGQISTTRTHCGACSNLRSFFFFVQFPTIHGTVPV